MIETVWAVFPGYEHQPMWQFLEAAELDGDASNWWVPNAAGLAAACRAAGFPEVRLVSAPEPGSASSPGPDPPTAAPWCPPKCARPAAVGETGSGAAEPPTHGEPAAASFTATPAHRAATLRSYRRCPAAAGAANEKPARSSTR